MVCAKMMHLCAFRPKLKANATIVDVQYSREQPERASVSRAKEMQQTFFVARCAKKMCTSALWVSSEAAWANAADSCFRPACPPCSTPTRMASRHSRGWVRWGALFWVSALAKSKIGNASPRGSSLSVLHRRCSVGGRHAPHSCPVKLEVQPVYVALLFSRKPQTAKAVFVPPGTCPGSP